MMDHAYQQHETFANRDHCEAKYDDDGRVGHCGQPKSAHVAVAKPEPKRWPRKVGWTKLLARRKACKHTWHFAVQFLSALDCPRCLRAEIAYWKGRTHSAEGQRDAMIRHAEKALAEVDDARHLIAT